MKIYSRNKWKNVDSLKLNSCSTDSYLSRFNEARQKLSIKVSIENYENQFFRSDFLLMLMYLCRVSFLTTLDIYKAYFRGRHIREYKENLCKRWPMPYSLWKKLLHLCALGFCNQVLLDLHCWWSEELCSQQSSSSWWLSRVLGSAQLVSHVPRAVHFKERLSLQNKSNWVLG